MDYVLIKGTFHVVGYQPDGDSIRFQANTKTMWKKLGGPKVRLNKTKGHAQLRIEAIDALETHYKSSHQPKILANEATDYLLKTLGIKNVGWGATHRSVVSANDGVPGYILSKKAEMYGRPVSFVFSGKINKKDGSTVTMTKALLKKSLNYKMLLSGMAFPTYYKGLHWSLRDILTDAAIKAYNQSKGVHPYDWTNIGVPVKNQKALEEDYALMPKFFRRLTAYNKSNSKKNFKEWMKTKKDPVLIVPIGYQTNLDSIIALKKGKASLLYYPEDLVFLS